MVIKKVIIPLPERQTRSRKEKNFGKKSREVETGKG